MIFAPLAPNSACLLFNALDQRIKRMCKGIHTFNLKLGRDLSQIDSQIIQLLQMSAGVIHSDFEQSFIRAEVIPYDEYIEDGGESGAKSAGHMRLEGKEYEIQDGDVVHFRVGA